MYIGHTLLCVFRSLAAFPHYCMDLDVTTCRSFAGNIDKIVIDSGHEYFSCLVCSVADAGLVTGSRRWRHGIPLRSHGTFILPHSSSLTFDILISDTFKARGSAVP